MCVYSTYYIPLLFINLFILFFLIFFLAPAFWGIAYVSHLSVGYLTNEIFLLGLIREELTGKSRGELFPACGLPH